mgnify:CR=1 FL=1
MGPIPIDLSECEPSFRDALLAELRHGHERTELEVKLEQRHIAEDQPREVKSIDGIGAARLNIPSTSFHYWGQRFGTYDCWRDGQFLDEYWRDNEASRIKATGTKIQVGWSPPRQPRFAKTFEPQHANS